MTEEVQLMPKEEEEGSSPHKLQKRSMTMWGDNWSGLSARSLAIRKSSASSADLLAKSGAGMNERQTKAVEQATKATLNALMNVHVTSKAEQEAREELDHAIATVKTLYKNAVLAEEAGTGAPVTPKRRFYLAVDSVRQLAGILRSHEGLHSLRKTLEDEWYEKALVTRKAERNLIETEATFCHSAESPHFDDEAPDTAVLDPNSEFRRLWDFIQVVFLVYVCIFVPYRVCFKDSPMPWRWDFILDIIVDLFFVVDVFLSFFTGYVKDTDGKTEYDGAKVKRHYLKSWFLIDFVSIIPINYILIIAGSEANAESGTKSRTVRIFRFLKFLKLLRLVRIQRILGRYEALLGVMHSTSSTLVSIVKLTIEIFFVGHLLSCFWFLVGEDEYYADGTLRAQGWIKGQAMDLVENDVTRFDQYLHSLYWAMTTMTTVGYGDISASTTAEKVYIMFAMLIGGFMFGIIIGSLTNIIGTNNPLEVNKQARLAEIAGWLQVRNVPLHLRQDIYEYYRTMYTLSETGISEREILDVLPHTLAEPLIKHMFGDIMAMECWKKLRLDTLPYWAQVEVCMNLRPVQVSAHHSYSKHKLQPEKPRLDKTISFMRQINAEERREQGTIFEEDKDDDRSIYIIMEGYVDIKKKKRDYQPDGTWAWKYDEDGHVEYEGPPERPHVRLRKGDCFGESCLLYLDDDAEYKRNYSAVAATDVTLLMLNRVAIANLRETQPEAFEKLKPFEMRRLEKMHNKAVDTLREQGVSFSSKPESKRSSSIDESLAADIQGVVSSAMQKMAIEMKQSVRTAHEESARLSNLEAKFDAMSATLQRLAESVIVKE